MWIVSERAPGEIMPWEVGRRDTREEAVKLAKEIKASKKGNYMADRLEYFLRETSGELLCGQ